MTKLPGDLLGRWVRLRERLEGYSPQMEAHEMHVDWSDICVLDAYLTDAWDESYMGPEPGKDTEYDSAPMPVEVQPPEHVREYVAMVMEGEFSQDELCFVVYNDATAYDWLF